MSVTEVFAHRGVHRIVRENTLGAFRAAIDLGVDGVELDVRRTADGALVIHHDPTVEGAVIAHARASELPAYVPRLDEAMTVLRGLVVNVEIKNSLDAEEPAYDATGTIVRETIGYLREAEWLDSVIISCFDRTTCEQVRDAQADVKLAWLVYGHSLPEALAQAHDLGFDAVNPHFSMLTRETADLAGELGLELNVWTVNEERDMREAGALGVASVITDEPERALEIFRSSANGPGV